MAKAPTHLKHLHADPKNARKRTPRSLGMIVDSLQSVGAARSIVIDEDNQILAGHGTVDAAGEAGITKVHVVDADGQTIVAVRRTGLTPDQKQRLALLDNRTAELAEWDTDVLQQLVDEGADLSKLWSEDELKALLATTEKTEGLTDPDDVPAERATGIKLGDLFQLGRHRLLCGDCTDQNSLDMVLAGETADLTLTDPPYGIGESYESFADSKQNLAALVAAFFPLMRHRSRVVLMTPGAGNQRLYPEPDWTLAWFVPAGTGNNRWGFTCWQPVLAYGKDPYLAERLGSRPDALVKTESAENSLGHPCPKPVGVWSWFMERGSIRSGAIVFDPFGGSGTTLIAAEQTGRTARLIELEPKYCQVAIDRWEAFTGEQAVKPGEVASAVA